MNPPNAPNVPAIVVPPLVPQQAAPPVANPVLLIQPPGAQNAPPVVAIGGGQGAPGIGVQAPQVEWKGLVNTLNLQPWELAYCMIHGTEEVTVLEALATSQYALVYIATQDEAAIKRQVTGAATMPLVNHYLTVMAGKVVVITAPRVCAYAPNPTERMYAWQNDRLQWGTIVREPTMVKATGNIGAQYADYGFKSAEATDWTDTVTSAETGVGNVTPVLPVAVAAGPANQATNSVGMLDVHSKLAALFMRGVPLKEAVRRGKAIQDMVPTAA